MGTTVIIQQQQKEPKDLSPLAGMLSQNELNRSSSVTLLGATECGSPICWEKGLTRYMNDWLPALKLPIRLRKLC